jgi:N-methylhydantoinase B
MPSWVYGADRFEAHDKPREELKIDLGLKLHTDVDSGLDPVTYEVLRHRIWQINDEQFMTISRVSGSSIATEINDFNVGITDEVGDIVIMGSGIVWHCNGDQAIKWVLENRSENPGIADGDLFLTNDPWIHANHQNDVTVLQPIFYDGELFCWTLAAVHQVDVGGINAGSFCFNAPDVFSEGNVFPAMKIVEGGELRKDMEDLYLRRSRTPELLALDLRAFIASANVTKRRILEMVERYGASTVKAVMRRTMDESETLLRERIKELPDGIWRSEEYQEQSMAGDRGVYAVRLAIEKKGDTLHFDFSASDEQAGLINSALGGSRGGATAIVLATLASDIPWAVGGIKRALKFNFKPGTVPCADYPGGVSAGSISGVYMVCNATIVAMAKMLSSSDKWRHKVISGSEGSWAVMYFAGIDQYGNPAVNIVMDALAAGIGARSWKDGDDTGGILEAPIGQMANVEYYESYYPFIYLYRREETDSGGAGMFRGGCGGCLGLMLHDTDVPFAWQWFVYGMGFPTSNGLCGRWPTKAVEAMILRGSNIQARLDSSELPADVTELRGERLLFQTKGAYEQVRQNGDIFHCYYQGGAGYGDPIDRDPARVLRDILNRWVSEEFAYEVYGVVLEHDKETVDLEATERRREEIRSFRREHSQTPQLEPSGEVVT